MQAPWQVYMTRDVFAKLNEEWGMYGGINSLPLVPHICVAELVHHIIGVDNDLLPVRRHLNH